MMSKCDWCQQESDSLKSECVAIVTLNRGVPSANTTIDDNLCTSCSIRLADAIEAASTAIADACHPSHLETVLEFNQCGVFRVDPADTTRNEGTGEGA